MADSLDVFSLELLFGAVEQYAQIVAVHAKLPADFVAVALVEKDGVEQGAIAGSQVEQNLPDLVFDLAGGHDIQGAGSPSGQFGRALDVERVAAPRGAVVLHEHVAANGIHKGAEALGLAQAAIFPENREDPRKGFLAHVFDCVQGLES